MASVSCASAARFDCLLMMLVRTTCSKCPSLCLQAWHGAPIMICLAQTQEWMSARALIVTSAVMQSQAAQIQALQEEVAYLRQQLEEQCEAMIEMAETVSSRLPRIVESATDTSTDHNNHRDSKDAAGMFEVRKHASASSDRRQQELMYARYQRILHDFSQLYSIHQSLIQ